MSEPSEAPHAELVRCMIEHGVSDDHHGVDAVWGAMAIWLERQPTVTRPPLGYSCLGLLEDDGEAFLPPDGLPRPAFAIEVFTEPTGAAPKVGCAVHFRADPDWLALFSPEFVFERTGIVEDEFSGRWPVETFLARMRGMPAVALALTKPPLLTLVADTDTLDEHRFGG